MEKRIIPALASEAEEADWWYEHREEITQDIIEAVREGRNGIGTRGRLQEIRERQAKEQAAAEPASSSLSSEDVFASAK